MKWDWLAGSDIFVAIDFLRGRPKLQPGLSAVNVKVCQNLFIDHNFTSRIMLIGEHVHTLDTKRRMSLPVKFRKILGKSVVITRGLDRCLFVYSISEWKKVTKGLAGMSYGSADSRAFVRFILGGAVETSVDNAGRILIADFLVKFASLRTSVIVAGLHNRVELWDEKRWGKYNLQVEKDVNELAENLGDIGMI